ncbi:hypothetical protein M514_00271 [Trichuris suis]|uniref:Uncharacterized protein n=1 Tax=Trichuris suis TaxID=68888 RepID=A0A085MPG2_9BILA|nr:hypothetical protein M513_00271 [Trichuris suis]KFD67871.1 hypothetical protein M514_00271 [Trichuris suis]KHJ46070.1 hypothetical protein D918_03733 [Trichuris suis]
MGARYFALFILLPLVFSVPLIDEEQFDERIITEQATTTASDVAVTSSEKSDSSSDSDSDEKVSTTEMSSPALSSLASEPLETTESRSDDKADRQQFEETNLIGSDLMQKIKLDDSSESSGTVDIKAEDSAFLNRSSGEMEKFSIDDLDESDVQAKLVDLLKNITRNMIESIRAVFANQEGEQSEPALKKEVNNEQEQLFPNSQEQLEIRTDDQSFLA